MLPNDSRDWGFHLVSYFQSALPEDLRESMYESSDFVMPNLSCLKTKSAEVTALNKMRNAAVVSYRKTQKERKWLESAMQAVDMTTNSNHHPVHNYRTDSHYEEGNEYVPHGY